MDWYENIEEYVADNHDPEEYEGRDWCDLTDEEQQEAIRDRIESLADSMEVM